MIEVKNTLNGKVNASIIKEYPELEEITVTPTLDGQELKPSKYGYSKITIEGIPATDVTVSPTEEEQNLQGIFKEVKVAPILTEEITTDLDFSSGDAIELTAQEGAYIKKTTINKPTNLSPENIKSGETVCGIAGTNADTSDADATSEDIVAGKTAYVANEKIQGTFKPLDTSDATATAEDIAEGKTAYVNGEKVTGTLELETGSYNAILDATNVAVFSVVNSIRRITGEFNIGNATSMLNAFSNCLNLESIPFFDTSKVTIMNSAFRYCYKIENIPFFDTSNVIEMNYTFGDCRALKTLPLFNFSKVQYMINTFSGCHSLDNEGLNNILAMCISAISYTGTKTLRNMGLTSAQATTCTTLSNYQAFLDAGWTTGY